MKKFSVLALGLLTLALFSLNALAAQEKGSYRYLPPGETKKFLEENPEAVLLDVRTPDEYEQVHIPGSVLIPDYELPSRMASELPDKNVPIVVYCRSGNRSRASALRLIQAGYKRVYDAGGINSWPYEKASGAYAPKKASSGR